MRNASDDYLLEAYLADLKSETLFLRELAVSQLHHHVEVPGVKEALSAAAAQETDSHLKAMLESLLAMAGDNNTSALAIVGQDGDNADLLQRWSRRELCHIKDMLQQMALLPVEQQTKTMVELVSEEPELVRLIPIFSLPNELIKKPETIDALAKLLDSNDYIFVIRLIPFLAENGRNHLIEALPKLLKHQNFMIRAESIRFLFKISKQHALRLLEELIFSDKASQKSASTFLLLFPFEDIQNIVLSLIDSGALQNPFLHRLITYLVANNPDPDFFKRLTVIEVLRGDDMPEVAALRRESAEALQITGVIKQDIDEFCANSLERIADYIKERAGISVVVDKSILPTTATATQQETVSSTAAGNAEASALTEPGPGKVEASANTKKLQEMLAKKAMSNDDKKVLRKLLLSRQSEDLSELTLKVVARFKPADSQAIKWLEEHLEKLAPRDSLVAMRLLAELNPTRLLPHLPVLSLCENEMLATQSIRLFKKHNLKSLLKHINSWLQEDSERFWKAAITALLQLKIETSRGILIKVFETTNRNSLIKFFSPVFMISPDHMTLYELELLSAKSRGSKHELLEEITAELKEALGITAQKVAEEAGTAALINAGVQIKWEELRQNLDKIRYISKNLLVSQAFGNFSKKLLATLVIAGLLLLVHDFWPGDDMPESSGAGVGQSSANNQSVPDIKAGESRIFRLDSYDPINRTWRATGLDTRVYRLKLPAPGDFSAGFKGDFKVLHFSMTRFGHPVVTCEPVAIGR